MDRKYKVAFYGGYTIHSAGDDAPLAFITAELEARFPGQLEFVVFSRHPNESFDDYFNVRTIKNFEYPSREEAAHRWMRGLNFDDDRGDLARIAEEIESSDIVILGAGNFITELALDIFKGHLAQFLVISYIAELCNTPVMFYGLSANVIKNRWTARSVAKMFESARLLTFREPKAIENLKLADIPLPDFRLLPDPAFGAPGASAEIAQTVLGMENIQLSTGPVLGVSVRDLSWMGGDQLYFENVTNLIQMWCKDRDRSVLFIPQCTYNKDSGITDDRYLANSIYECLADDIKSRVHVVKGEYYYKEIQSLYLSVDIALATRLHGCVFALTAHKPVVGLAYEDKVAGLFQSMELEEWCLSWNASTDEMLSKLESALSKRSDLERRISQAVLEKREAIKEYVDCVEQVLVSG